jgi:hypothetical protein
LSPQTGNELSNGNPGGVRKMAKAVNKEKCADANLADGVDLDCPRQGRYRTAKVIDRA